MTDIDKAIVEEIKNDPELASLLQGETEFKLYPIAIPEGINPEMAIVYSDTLTSNTYPNAETSLYDFKCIAKKYSDSLKLANLVKELFNDKKNNNLGGILTVTYTKFENKTSLFDEDDKNYITVVEILINY